MASLESAAVLAVVRPAARLRMRHTASNWNSPRTPSLPAFSHMANEQFPVIILVLHWNVPKGVEVVLLKKLTHETCWNRRYYSSAIDAPVKQHGLVMWFPNFSSSVYMWCVFNQSVTHIWVGVVVCLKLLCWSPMWKLMFRFFDQLKATNTWKGLRLPLDVPGHNDWAPRVE